MMERIRGHNCEKKPPGYEHKSGSIHVFLGGFFFFSNLHFETLFKHLLACALGTSAPLPKGHWLNFIIASMETICFKQKGKEGLVQLRHRKPQRCFCKTTFRNVCWSNVRSCSLERSLEEFTNTIDISLSSGSRSRIPGFFETTAEVTMAVPGTL